MNNIDSYISLIDKFVSHKISLAKFRISYMEEFKNDQRMLGEPIFPILNGLFGDADMCTSNKQLLGDYPEFYIDEKTLREKAAIALKQLDQIIKSVDG